MAENRLSNGMYPIDVTVTGKKDGKDIPAATYRLNYSPAEGQYIVPKNYPITADY